MHLLVGAVTPIRLFPFLPVRGSLSLLGIPAGGVRRHHALCISVHACAHSVALMPSCWHLILTPWSLQPLSIALPMLVGLFTSPGRGRGSEHRRSAEGPESERVRGARCEQLLSEPRLFSPLVLPSLCSGLNGTCVCVHVGVTQSLRPAVTLIALGRDCSERLVKLECCDHKPCLSILAQVISRSHALKRGALSSTCH